jgi:hypothetical protein
MKKGWKLLPIFLLFGVTAWVAEYYPYLDYLVAGAYLWALWRAAREFGSLLEAFVGAVIAQLPGILFWLFVIDAYYGSHTMPPEFAYLVMLWFSPQLPIASLFSVRISYYNLYFLLMFFSPFIVVGLMCLGSYLHSFSRRSSQPKTIRC